MRLSSKKRILILSAIFSIITVLLSLLFCVIIHCRLDTFEFWRRFLLENLFAVLFIGFVAFVLYRNSRLTLSFLFGANVMIVAYNIESFDKSEGLYVFVLITLWLAIRVIWYSKIHELFDRFKALRIFDHSLIYLFIFFIISAFSINTACVLAPTAEKVDYAIVLGAPVLDDRASDVLKVRIETAAEYLQQDSECRIILTGGSQVEGQRTEAEIIYDGLTAFGIDPARIILDLEAKSTFDNFEYSADIINLTGGSKSDRVAIITSEFHTLRSGILAERYGLTNVSYVKAQAASIKDFEWYMREVPTVYATLLGLG